jgi:hypothetical protein
MKNTFEIRPRQTGKTTELIEAFLKDPSTALFITHNRHMKQHVIRMIREIHPYMADQQFWDKKVLCPAELNDLRRTAGTRAGIEEYEERIFVDEYLFFRKECKRALSEFKSRFPGAKWCIKTTSDRKYDMKLIDMVRCIKSTQYPDQILNWLKAEYQIEIVEQGLWDNLLTDPDIPLPKDNRSQYSESQYMLYVAGQWCK